MLRGELVGLRARVGGDVAILHAELYDDMATRSRADTRPWRPIGVASSPYAPAGSPDDADVFSVVILTDGELAGEALLWGVDGPNRSAHLGLSLRPAFRGRRLGADVVAVLCRYGFATRGLHRLQIETLADNTAMLRAVDTSGFAVEGVLAGAAWVDGRFADQVVLGLLDGQRTDPKSPTAQNSAPVTTPASDPSRRETTERGVTPSTARRAAPTSSTPTAPPAGGPPSKGT